MPFVKLDVYACPHCGFPLRTKEEFLFDKEETKRMNYCPQCGKEIASDVRESLTNTKD